jgi:uncharacterized protein YoxC
MSTPSAAPSAGPVHRLLGLVIMIKAALPALVVAVLALGVWQIVAGVSRAFDEARSVIEPQLALAQAQVDSVRAEGRRLLAEVKKIENTTVEVAGAVKESVEPIRQSLVGLASTLKTVSGALGGLLNALVRVVNGLPFVKDLPEVRLPDIELPGLVPPKLNIDLDLEPRLQVVRQLNDTAQTIATEAEKGIARIAETVRFWWWCIKLAAALILAWLVLTVVGHVARAVHRFASGWRMLCGHRVDGALALL